MVMLDTLRALDNPLNDYALVALMRSPMFSFNEDSWHALRYKQQKMTIELICIKNWSML